MKLIFIAINFKSWFTQKINQKIIKKLKNLKIDLEKKLITILLIEYLKNKENTILC